MYRLTKMDRSRCFDSRNGEKSPAESRLRRWPTFLSQWNLTDILDVENKHEGVGVGAGGRRWKYEMSQRPPAKREKKPSLLYLDWHVLLWLHLFLSGQAERVYWNKWKRANKCGLYEKRVLLSPSAPQWFSPPTRPYIHKSIHSSPSRW